MGDHVGQSRQDYLHQHSLKLTEVKQLPRVTLVGCRSGTETHPKAPL